MRSLPEWIGTTPDSPIPPRVKLRCFERYGRQCQCGCGKSIASGDKWDLDHSTALANGGVLERLVEVEVRANGNGNRESNLQPMLREHHRKKTRTDVAIKGYNYKRRLANAGIKRRKSRPMFGSKASGWKITFSRGAVRR